MFVVITGRLFNDNKQDGGLVVYGDDNGQPFLTYEDARTFVYRQVDVGDFWSIQIVLKSLLI